jgi:hypothetical protein
VDAINRPLRRRREAVLISATGGCEGPPSRNPVVEVAERQRTETCGQANPSTSTKRTRFANVGAPS